MDNILGHAEMEEWIDKMGLKEHNSIVKNNNRIPKK